MEDKQIEYLPGFGNHFCSEAVPGTLPEGQNTPQKCPKDLYAEQLSGTAFTEPRGKNQRTWFYRMRPSAGHEAFEKMETAPLATCADWAQCSLNPSQFRWNPLPIPSVDEEKVDWVRGLKAMAGTGSPALRAGIGIYIYAANTSMGNTSFNNSDGDLLIVPQQGTLHIRTEFGLLEVKPCEIAVIQRGMRFCISLSGPSRGYVLEVYDGHFELPDLGPIGANGLANPRDFLSPVAAYEDREGEFTVINKFGGKLWQAKQDHSPYDVVAWHGNYVPYKYDLNKFCVVNSVSYDHLDPSIFTVLTCKTNKPGVAAADFVIFPARWSVQEHTFRIPYLHRNCMSEYMGLIHGSYEAKAHGFQPGGGSLHSCMTPHGPDAESIKVALEAKLVPERVSENALAFMFESTYIFGLTPYAERENVDKDYYKCWMGVPKLFKP